MPSTPTDSSEIKRAACDRCRSQKLRCIPETPEKISGTCKRCGSASTQCVYSPPTRPGRPPSLRHLAAASSKNARRDTPLISTYLNQDSESPSTYASTFSQSDPFHNAAEQRDKPQHDQCPQPCQQSQQQHGYSYQQTTSCSYLAASIDKDHTLGNIGEEDPLYAHNLFSKGSTNLPNEEMVVCNTYPVSEQLAFTAPTPWRAELRPDQIDGSSTSPQLIPIDLGVLASNQMPWTNVVGQDSPFEGSGQQYMDNSTMVEDSIDYVNDDDDAPVNDSPSITQGESSPDSLDVIAQPDFAASKDNLIQSCIRRLSELSSKLYVQVSSDSSGTLNESMGNDAGLAMAQHFKCLTGQVLESSASFVDILASLRDSHPPSDAPGIAATDPYIIHNGVGPRGSFTSQSSNYNASTGFEHQPRKILRFSTPTMTTSDKMLSASSSTTSGSSSHPLILDTATMLQLLIVYIRLTQLHGMFYDTIKKYLSHAAPTTSPGGPPHSIEASEILSSSSSATILPPFPSLAIGGISLQPYGHFQIKLVLQICVHQLGIIEAALGLPAAFRISRSDWCTENARMSDQGVLGWSHGETAPLIQAVMIEAGNPVQKNRETLALLRDELRGSIDI